MDKECDGCPFKWRKPHFTDCWDCPYPEAKGKGKEKVK
jgi:hypothetical protein